MGEGGWLRLSLGCPVKETSVLSLSSDLALLALGSSTAGAWEGGKGESRAREGGRKERLRRRERL